MKDIVRLTDANFTGQSIQNHEGNSLVIFSADWCPYCVSFFNNWEEYGKIDNTLIADVTDVDSKLWDDFDLDVVPSMAIFVDGKLEKRWNGLLGRGLTINQIEDVSLFFSKL